jgi:hypothetical protein
LEQSGAFGSRSLGGRIERPSATANEKCLLAACLSPVLFKGVDDNNRYTLSSVEIFCLSHPLLRKIDRLRTL